MIISRTPFRLSFFGGGTDYPVYYREHGGAVLNTTIDRYCYITCRYLPPFFDHQYRIRYTKKELTQTIDEIRHPSVRECLKFMGIKKGVEMVHSSDIPAMSGIGSSSSFTVGFLNALNALKGQITSKRRLAMDAIHVEQECIGESVGSQDQTAVAFGGLNKITFRTDGGIQVDPVTIPQEKIDHIQGSLMFFFTGFPRFSSDIAATQIKETPNRIKELGAMHAMVDQSVDILNGRIEDLDDFGRLLHETWRVKRELTNVISNDSIDEIYQDGLAAGALGGKVCGAGGGGFIVFFVPENARDNVRKALSRLLHVPIGFETLGSHIAFYSK